MPFELASYSTGQADSFLSSAETPVGMMETSVRRAAVDVGVRRVRAYARRANSEDSIEVLSTTESIFPDDLTAITEEEAEHQPLSNGFNNKEVTLTECKSALKEENKVNGTTLESENKNVQGDEDCADREESFKQISVSGGIMIKEAIECLKKNQVHKDSNPHKMSKQGNTTPVTWIAEVPFKHVLWYKKYSTSTLVVQGSHLSFHVFLVPG